MIIEAHTSLGTIIIEATAKYSRKYSWHGKTKEFSLSPRSERWLGNRGIYRPHGDRTMHAVLEEGQAYFYSEEEVCDWIALRRRSGRGSMGYTSDGLIIMWHEEIRKSDGFIALGVNVVQIYVKGRKPTDLRGAEDGKFSIKHRQTTPETEAGQFSPQMPKEINGRLFAGRALDLMLERHIEPQQVEHLLKTAKPSREGEYLFYLGEAFSSASVVATDQTGRVVEVW